MNKTMNVRISQQEKCLLTNRAGSQLQETRYRPTAIIFGEILIIYIRAGSQLQKTRYRPTAIIFGEILIIYRRAGSQLQETRYRPTAIIFGEILIIYRSQLLETESNTTVTNVSALRFGSCWILQYNLEYSLCPESHSLLH